MDIKSDITETVADKYHNYENFPKWLIPICQVIFFTSSLMLGNLTCKVDSGLPLSKNIRVEK